MDQKILDYCIEKWNQKFEGISSYNVSEKLGISHKKVRKTFKRFKSQNKGTLSENVVLDLSDYKRKGDQPAEIIATVFFPSKESLEESFNKMAKQDTSEFKKRLHLGHRRKDLAYFSNSVLERYFNSEEFDIHDSFCGGFLTGNTKFMSGLPKRGSKKSVPTVRFAKRKLNEKEQVVTAILEDLAELPDSEQTHWRLSEIENPNFSLFDANFHKYYLRYYHGVPVNSYDPLHGLLDVLKKINSLPNVGSLFNNLKNIRLKYPVGKSFDDFRSSCLQLYEVIGPENLNTETLKDYLSRNYNLKDKDFWDGKISDSLNKRQLFRKFLKARGCLSNSLDKLVAEIEQYKLSPRGKSTSSSRGKPDFLSEYKDLCQSLQISFNILYEDLRR